MRRRLVERLKVWHWTDPIYDTTVFLLRGPWPEAEKYLMRTFNVKKNEVGDGYGAKTIWLSTNRGSAAILWFPAWIDLRNARHVGTIAHEAYHAATFILRDRGMKTTPHVDEAVAYHITWMVENVVGRLKK